MLAARPAFGGSTEAEHLVKFTDRHLRHGDVDWLEIGAGDGRNLAYQLSRLSTHRTFRVVALEPAAGDPAWFHRIEWLRLRAEDYHADRWFHWINMRHSAYYLQDPVSEIVRLVGMLHHEGALALTHWSRECILRRLHAAICGEHSDLATAGVEDLSIALAEHPRLLVSEVLLLDTELCTEQVVGDPVVGEALHDLVCRGRVPLARSGIDRACTVARALRDIPNATVRRNGLVIIRRRPD